MHGEGKILVYGYGNPGRRDDGLGIALVSMVEELGLRGVVCDSNYQLNVEDALGISSMDAVIFADASLEACPPFAYTEIEPSGEITFTTHAMSPHSVLALCQELYQRRPRCFLLAIRGYAWEMGMEMTREAAENLEKAFNFVREILKNSSVADMEPDAKAGTMR